jgi:hypothetical protein
MVWNTFSPVARTAREYFDVQPVYVDALSFVFMVIYIPFIVPASWVLSKYSIAVGVFVGGFMNAMGAWLRYIGVVVPLSQMGQYYIVFAGQTVGALAQCFILQVRAQTDGREDATYKSGGEKSRGRTERTKRTERMERTERTERMERTERTENGEWRTENGEGTRSPKYVTGRQGEGRENGERTEGESTRIENEN